MGLLTVVNVAILVTIGWSSINTLAFAKEKHTEEHSGHELNEMEVGLSIGYAYLQEEKESGLNLHLHVMKRLSGEGFQRYLSIGWGVETIISKEKHFGTMVSLAVHPWRNLVLSISPGIEWAEHDGKWGSKYASHIEAVYTFEGLGFHYGPVVGYSRTSEEQHYTVGVHFGIPF
ncbi:MAG: hypothetical protein L3K24_08635 [Gammaproteobacteria bacterium]|nr:hypothetical protein [Gammaproteobacteria bacterium]